MAARAATLENLFRTVNERLRERVRQLRVQGRTPLICECSNRDCLQVLELSEEEYAAVRSSPHRYAVLPGHADLEVERVLEQRDGFDIIEKPAISEKRP
jgi:hypothetical protein